MLAFVIVLQVLVALFLIGVVLLQPGNRGGASAALGGAGSDTVFGARGANTFLSKITFGAAVCFMVTNLALSYMSSSYGNRSVMKALEETQKTDVEKKASEPHGEHEGHEGHEHGNEAAPPSEAPNKEAGGEKGEDVIVAPKEPNSENPKAAQ